MTSYGQVGEMTSYMGALVMRALMDMYHLMASY